MKFSLPCASRLAVPLIGLLAMVASASLRAEIPTVLTDKIYKGNGVIDLMKDASGTELAQYMDANGRLLLGVDVNEAADGTESSSSQGLAIKDVQLLITTTAGSFSFSDIFTNTTAELTEAGSTTTNTYYTLFGQGGSSNITSGTTGFDLSKFDDVLEVRNVSFSGSIVSAKLVVNFLDVNKGHGANAAFFDYSGGFEDFAILTARDAQVLEAAAIGTQDVATGVTYTTTTVSSTYYTTPSTTAVATPSAAPAAPEPPLVLLLGGAVVALMGAARGKLARRA